MSRPCLAARQRHAGPSRISAGTSEVMRPSSPLVLPPLELHHRPQRPLAQRLDPVDGLEVEDAFLQVGSEHQEVEELGDPRPGETELAGEVGAVAEVATVDLGLESMSERQHLGDARRAAQPGWALQWLFTKRQRFWCRYTCSHVRVADGSEL